MKHDDSLKRYPAINLVSVVFPGIPGVQTASFLSMSGWQFFGYLKSPAVEPPSNAEMALSYFLLHGRLAWVGERSMLVVHL